MPEAIGKDTPEFSKSPYCLNSYTQTIVFEDALHAIKSAKAAGFPVAAVYDKSSYEDQKEMISIADIYLNSFEDWEMIL